MDLLIRWDDAYLGLYLSIYVTKSPIQLVRQSFNVIDKNAETQEKYSEQRFQCCSHMIIHIFLIAEMTG
jgi:hypothetical protein